MKHPTAWNSTLPNRTTPLRGRVKTSHYGDSGVHKSSKARRRKVREKRYDIARSVRLERKAELKSRRRGRKCYAHLRQPLYRRFVRSRGCILAGVKDHVCEGLVEFAHLHNEGTGGADVGNGIGLCRNAGHQFGAKSWHVLGKKSWPAYWGVDPYAVAAELAEEYEDEQGKGFRT